MVNGGTRTFAQNGWHGMYDLSGTKECGRIYKLDINFTLFKEHAMQAYAAWKGQRQWLTHEWHAE